MDDRSGSCGLDSDALTALRRAAAMAHSVGGIELRLTAGGRSIATVAPHAASRPGRLHPCAFRHAVAGAWNDHRSGRDVGLVGVRDSRSLAIEWRVRPPGALLGFGAVRVRCAHRFVWAFASVLSADDLGVVLPGVQADSVGGVPTGGDDLCARLVHDDQLGTTVVHVDADPARVASARAIDEVLRRLLAAVAAAEVASAFDPARR